MKTRSHSLLRGLILCTGLALTIWGCENNAPKKSENKICKNCKEIDSLYDVAWDLGSNNPDSAKKIAEVMIEKSREENYFKGFANAYNLIGGIYRRKGILDKAIDNYYLSINYFEKTGDTIGIAKVSINIGTVFVGQKNYPKAMDFYSKALNVFERNKDSLKISNILNNIGTIFDYQKNYNQALEFYLNSLEVSKKIGDKKGLSMSYDNIGNVYRKKGNYKKALDYLSKSLILEKKSGNKEVVASLLLKFSMIYKNQKKYQIALNKVNEGLKISQEIDNRILIGENYLNLSDIYDSLKDCSKAYNYYQLYTEVKGRILDEQSAKQVAEAATKYETAEKNKEIVVINKDRKIKEEQIAKERQKFYFVFGIGLIIVIASLFLFKLYRAKKRANILLELKNVKIEKQKSEIEAQKREITASITYAERIQKAMLPPKGDIYSVLQESFVLYKPKDIVSGDFYWFKKIGDHVLLAVADCTGHGVPGAFMSMIGIEALNKASEESQDPGEILAIINKAIKKSLRQSGQEDATRDGMDIALIKLLVFDEGKKAEDTILGLKYAGANRPLWITRNGSKDVVEIKADKKAIAGFTPDDQIFKTHEISVVTGDTIYLSSDGYADQFGGPDGKKLMTKKFKELLISVQDQDMNYQEKFLDETIENWKNGTEKKYEQVDDNLVIGVKIA